MGLNLQEHGESLIDADVLRAEGPALHIVVVSIADYEVEAQSLPCATNSALALADFWMSAATGRGPFLPEYPLGSISVLQVAADQQGHVDVLMRRLEACLRIARTNDTAILHWIGHGEIDQTGKQFLLLARQSRVMGRILERAALPTLVDWFAAVCGAHRQYFFFDCCSLSKAQQPHDEWGPSRVVNTHLRQVIYVSSGRGQAALARRTGSTLFTESFLQVLSLHPADTHRHVFVGDTLIEALAGGVLQRLVADTLPLPDEYDLQHGSWRESLVRVEQAPTPSHRGTGRFSLGRAQAAQVGACILTKPSGANRLPVHHEPSSLRAYSYRGSINIEAFVGNAAEGIKFKLKFGAGTGSEMIIESAQMMLPFVQDWKSA